MPVCAGSGVMAVVVVVIVWWWRWRAAASTDVLCVVMIGLDGEWVGWVQDTCICCFEAPATIWCENCGMALCSENKCAVNLHLFPESMQTHKQKPINSAASAASTAQARDRLTQLLASLQANAEEDKNKKKDGKGTTPNPQHRITRPTD